jgi:hypothetical protein
MTDSLAKIDPLLHSWAISHDLKLLTFDENRCVYLGSESECCQIWLAGPLKEQIVVHASDVESLGDEEMDFSLTVPIADLQSALEAAYQQVSCWFKRTRTQA